MGVKKKKGSSRKKGSKSSSSKDDVINDDPTTLIANGTATKSGSKKKGKKGKKVSKGDKAQEKLEQACDAIRNDKESFNFFVTRMEKWLLLRAQKAVDLLCRSDFNGDGVLNYDEFKSGMYDLDVPCNSVQLHLLCQLLDRNGDGSIDYTELSNGLSNERENESEEDEDYENDGVETVHTENETEQDMPVSREVKLILKTVPLERCICCSMAICEPYKERNPRYIELLLRLVTFESLRAHPGHFNRVVHAHIPIYGIIKIIEQIAGIQSSKLAVFTDKSRTKDAMLHPESTLEECGFLGGTKLKPEELLLYYDYNVEFVDCPILMCDYYFGGDQ